MSPIPRGPRHNPWPWGIGLGLGLVVAVNMLMVHIAVSNPSAPAAKDPYGESQRWDEVQAERGRARALGWRVELQPCATLEPEGCAVVLRVRDSRSAPVLGLHGRLRAERADDAAYDREAAVTSTAEAGDYLGVLALVRPGLYTVTIRLEGGPAPWVDERRIMVPPPAPTPEAAAR